MLATHDLHAPHLIDWELMSGMRRLVGAGTIPSAARWRVLATWRGLAATRYPSAALLERMWQLRDNLSSYDAGYVALAETLECPLLTADGRISRVPGVECQVIVVPR